MRYSMGRLRSLTVLSLRRVSPPCTVAAVPLGYHQCRYVHERSFVELHPDLTRGEAYEHARDALLQLNIMIRRGIEPDPLMYTSLIATMGRAGLEWQAYKLFSRMIEQGIRPLPETYVALRDATQKSRTGLRDHIQTKIEAMVDTFPEELADAEMQRQQEEDRLCIAKFNEYMRGELPPPAKSEAAPVLAEAATSSDEQKQESSSSEANYGPPTSEAPIATMRIRNPTDVWHTAEMAESLQDRDAQRAHGAANDDCRQALSKLHDEELRIFLAAQRQLRHGTRTMLIDRILNNVSERSIRAMLDRRRHYFSSVAELLATDLRELSMSSSSRFPTTSVSVSKERDRTLTSSEKNSSSPEVLSTPWGILRKPTKQLHESSTPRNAERLERIRLSEHELLLVRKKAESKELDELPEALLRRYAFQFQLRWRRRVPLSLHEAVQWHVTTYFSTQVTPDGVSVCSVIPDATPAMRRQEAEGMQRTLENYEAFRIISQRTNNLQVVDNQEINIHLCRVRREARQRERRAEDHLRREKNVLAAASLASAAKTFTAPPPDSQRGSHVLGAEQDGGKGSLQDYLDEQTKSRALLHAPEASEGSPASTGDATSAATDTVHELPPWELFGAEEEFNLSTGRFGDPEVGRYKELSDSHVRLLPTAVAQKKWSVERQLLPSTLQDIVQTADLQLTAQKEAIEREYHQKLKHTRYRKWDSFLQKAQAKKLQQRAAAEEEEVKPLPPRRRLAQLLRHGKDKAKVSEKVRATFSKSL